MGTGTINLDFSTLTGAVGSASIISAIMAIAIVKLAPNFTKWAVGKLTAMFGGN